MNPKVKSETTDGDIVVGNQDVSFEVNGLKLQGKVALITGSTSGIGSAIAELFAEHGASVVVVGRNRERGLGEQRKIRQTGGKALFLRADVTKTRDVRRLVQRTFKTYGKIDILVNSAGIDLTRCVGDTSEEEWDKLVDSNLKSVFLCCKYAIPTLRQSKKSCIINISSRLGYVPSIGKGAYCASKAGVILLTKVLGLELAGDGIRANVICPGPTQTPMLSDLLHQQPDNAKAMQALRKAIPLRRLGSPLDVAKAALFLASEDADYISSTTLMVDGGVGDAR